MNFIVITVIIMTINLTTIATMTDTVIRIQAK